MWHLGDQKVKGLLKDEREITEKLKYFFDFVFIVEDRRYLPPPELPISGGVAKDLNQTEVMRESIL